MFFSTLSYESVNSASRQTFIPVPYTVCRFIFAPFEPVKSAKLISVPSNGPINSTSAHFVPHSFLPHIVCGFIFAPFEPVKSANLISAPSNGPINSTSEHAVKQKILKNIVCGFIFTARLVKMRLII